MNKRSFVRYGSELLPGILSKATIAWAGTTLNESYVVNYSAHGIHIVIPPLASPFELPAENDVVKVLLPVAETWFTGNCVHVEHEGDGSICLGIHFQDAGEQNHLQTLLFNSLKAPEKTGSFVSYEWEELVGKLCASDDPNLKKIGYQHLAVLKARQQESLPG